MTTVPSNVYLVFDKHLLPLRHDKVRLGRYPDNDLIIAERGVSRHHAEIRFENGEFVLHDLNATNGTLVNGDMISKHSLASGDTITLGNTPLLFIDRRNEDEAEAGMATGKLGA